MGELTRFKALYPENTLYGMRAAVKAGATVIETDVQIAADGVVVISHDLNTYRCFGSSLNIHNTPYIGQLSKLETSGEFKEKLPTLEQVAQLFVNDEEFSDIQLMLDIKRSNEPWVIERIVAVLESVNPDLRGFWSQRMVFGIWRLDVLKACQEYAPGFPILHIGVSRNLAKKFLGHQEVIGVSLIHIALRAAGGHRFISEVKTTGKAIYSWTINDLQLTKWAVSERLDGIVTDNPELYVHFIDSLSEGNISKYQESNPSSYSTWKSLSKSTMLYGIINLVFTAMDLIWFVTPRKKSCDVPRAEL